MLFEPYMYVCFHIFSSVGVTDWPPIGGIAAHLANDMSSWYTYMYLSVILVVFFFHPSVYRVGISF